MKRLIYILLTLNIIISFTSCAVFQPSMTPIEVHKTLPTLTKSIFLTVEQTETSNCKRLTQRRSYTAPIGMTVKGDLRNGAKGIDEWVTLDGGNAYALTNYQWITVGFNPQYGTSATQLYIEFDIYLCNGDNRN